jgi:hypothetical protein
MVIMVIIIITTIIIITVATYKDRNNLPEII